MANQNDDPPANLIVELPLASFRPNICKENPIHIMRLWMISLLLMYDAVCQIMCICAYELCVYHA